MMTRLRWVMDGQGFWEVDASTPRTIDGLARPVPGDTLPLGVSRGTRLSRPKQIDFLQRFMAAPFVPSYAGDPSRGGHGFALQRVLTIPFGQNWFTTVLGQFSVQKFVSSMKSTGDTPHSPSLWLQKVGRQLMDKSLYAVGFCSELLLSPDDTLLVSLDRYAEKDSYRKKAVFHHKFPYHDLTVEAVSPGLFVDKAGNYWDVPNLVAVDLASVASTSGASYHLSLLHNSGSPECFYSDGSDQVPTSLLPGLSLKGAFAFKKNIEFWRSNASKLKLVQPFDIFLSNPHVSASGIIGAAVTAFFGDNSERPRIEEAFQGFRGVSFKTGSVKSAFVGDMFGSLSFTAQHGNFQRRFLDLTRFHARLNFPSGSKFLSGAIQLAQDFVNSQQPSLDALHAICPHAHLSFQQQITGPFSFRVESGIAIDLRNLSWSNIRIEEPIFAIEYALQVLGSAKATAWYSPKQQEFMVELRFFET